MTQTVTVRLNRPQTAARRALQPHNTVTLAWGRGVGKSWFVRLVWYLLVAQWDGKLRPGAKMPGVRIVLLMPTLVQAKKVHLALLQSELTHDWAFLGGALNKTDWRVTFPGGSWIQWITAENADLSRGVRCDVVTIDEADDVDTETVDGIIAPWFSEPHSLGMRLICGTPRRGRYGLLYRSYKCLDHVGERIPEAHAFHATYRDVPDHVSTEYVERERRNIAPEVFKREWECDFDAAEGLVYDIFRESFHVRPPPAGIGFNEILVGCDWGYEDPFCFIACGVAGSGADATLYMLREAYQTHKTAPEILDVARQWRKLYPQARWFADPSQPAMIELLRREAGVNIKPADNAIEDGVAAVASRLLIRKRHDGSEWARLYVDPSCRNLIREFGLYRRKRDPRNRERVLDDIEDKNNHAADSVRYLTFSRFGKAPAIRIDDDPGW